MTFKMKCGTTLFLTGISTALFAQNATLNSEPRTPEKQSDIEHVTIRVNRNRGSEALLVAEQKKSLQMVEKIGNAQLEKQGVGDMAAAVSKAAGAQKQEGSGQIFVRGLGDRYNTTTLNGLEIPSDNPEFKNINLEIFSASTVDYLALNKVYSSTFSGDFGGAAIDIGSKTQFGKSYLKLGIGSSLNLQTFNRTDFKLQDGGPGFFGFKKAAYLPGDPNSKYPFTTKWDFASANNPFASSLNIEAGLTKGKLGVFAFAGFGNNYEFTTGQEGDYFADGGANKRFGSVERSAYKTATTALLNLNYRLSDQNKTTFTSNYIHTSEQEAKIYKGFSYDVSKEIIINRGDNKLTDTWINQLFGNHGLRNNWTFNWALGFNFLNSRRPDRLQNTIDAETRQFIAGSAVSNHRYFDELKDLAYLGRAQVTKKIGDKVKIAAGYDASLKDRSFNQVTFGINFKTASPVDPSDIDTFINPANNDQFIYNVQRSDYTIRTQVQSGFGEIDVYFNDKMTVQIGGRFDYLNFKNSWSDILDTNRKNKTYYKVLPSVNAKYSLTDKHNLRMAVSKTYTLPQAKELIPISYYDVTANVYGNPNLYPSDNYNADLKWEYFPKSSEIISLTAFGKYIQNPIGRSKYSSASPSDLTYFNIADYGFILGGEAEMRKDLFHWNSSRVYAFVNVSFLHSEQKLKISEILAAENSGKTVEYSGQSKEEIQGVANFIANANLAFNHTWRKNNAVDFTISYSRTGENLYAIGTNFGGNFYELAKDILDLTLNISVNQYGIGLQAKNLLNPHYTIQQVNAAGTFIHKDYTRGSELGLNLSYKF